MTRLNTTLPLLAVLLNALFVLPAAAQTRLSWKLSAGEKYDQVIEQDMQMSFQANGQDFKTNMTQTVNANWNVKSVDEQGTAEIIQKISRIRMKMTGVGGINVDIDTSSEEAATGLGAVLAGPLKAMAKAEFTITMTRDGEITDVQLSEDAVNALKSAAQIGGGQMGGMLSKEGMVNMLKQGTPGLPKEAVQKGAQWNKSMEMVLPQVGTMVTNQEMTYAGPVTQDGKTLEVIDLDLTTNLKGTNAKSAVKLKLKDQSAKGKMYFDNQAGRLDHTELKQSMTMEVTAANQVITQNIDQTVTVTMTPVQ